MRIPFFDCRACVEHASELLDGELPPLTRFVLAVHARFCQDCRAHVAQLETTVEVVRHAVPADRLGGETRRALLDELAKRPPP